MQTWNVLDVGSVWMKEYASALQKTARVNAWQPRMQLLGALRNWQSRKVLVDPPLGISLFPLQRGYARPPLRWALPYHRRLLKRLLSQTEEPWNSPLVCSTPFYAPVAELWPGPVIYYVTDLTVAYPSVDADQVRALDRRLCRVAQAVCPNSRRIAEYLTNEAGCDRGKITVVPNATRANNVLESPLLVPAALPADLAHLKRPIVGVMGDLSTNLDWLMLQEAIERTPQLQWVFVGPATRPIQHAPQAAARARVQTMATFVGAKPYRELQSYARCFDAAVLPYLRREPTYSGSSTRFYEHLAACRPMVASRGFAELLEKEPLLRLASDAADMVEALGDLEANNFRDGHETERWQASQSGTWERRVECMRAALTAGPQSLSVAAPHLPPFSQFVMH